MGKVRFRFGLAKQWNTDLKIYDILGNEISSIVSGRLNAGIHEFEFDASILPQGTYIYVLDIGYQVFSSLMTILR